MTTDYKRLDEIYKAYNSQTMTASEVELRYQLDEEGIELIREIKRQNFREGAKWADQNPAPSLNDPYIEPCLNALTKTILKSDEMAQLLIKPYLEALDKLGLIIKSRDEEIIKLKDGAK